jgi:hypothetical protein
MRVHWVFAFREKVEIKSAASSFRWGGVRICGITHKLNVVYSRIYGYVKAGVLPSHFREYPRIDVAIHCRYVVAMENRVAISLKLPPSLLKRVDAARRTLPVEPTRTACIEAAIEGWLASVERSSKKGGK